MFSEMELRVINHSVKLVMKAKQDQLKFFDSEPDDAIEISNDLMLFQSIIEKIKENRE